MSTVEKAMNLLNYFSTDRAEIGLSEFQQLASRDKATTYRHLSALVASGILERNPVSRGYRIGPAVLRLAYLREQTVPRHAGVRLVIPALAEATGETAHASILQGTELVTLAVHTSTRHSTRVILSEATLPLHATGSGLAVLAFSGAALTKAALGNLKPYTQTTIADASALKTALDTVRRTGFGVSPEGYEAGVSGIAVPVFDSTHSVSGAVAIASVTNRLTPELVATIRSGLIEAARRISQSWGGRIPAELEQAWQASTPQTYQRQEVQP